jgi:GTPase SAR1 family protein
MDWEKLQEEVRGLIPPRELEASSCWVGVLHHDKDPQECLTQNDFLWMIGRGVSFPFLYSNLRHILTCIQKTSLQKIRDNYGERFNITDFHIQFRNAVVDYQNTISVFQALDDNLILFMAVLADKAPDVLELTNSVASHTTAETPPLSTDVNNEGSSKVLQGFNILASLENAETSVKEEPQPFHGVSLLSPLSELTDFSFPIDRSENGYRTPSHSEAEFPMNHFIQNIIDQGSPDILEAGIAESLRLLAKLRHCFAQHTTPSGSIQSWIDSIDKLSLQRKCKRMIFGVVGNTGAGKSSVINALLDEERLLPTNCMRACTAVVTELSWNYSEDPSSKYRAQIEFITPEDWKKELNIIIRDLLTESEEVCREASDINTDAGVAWAKFRAVYPHIKRKHLNRRILDDLMAGSDLEVLGTTRTIEAAEPACFYQELQRYVDSKEKVDKKGTKQTTRLRKRKVKKRATKSERESIGWQTRRMGFWPLIKVVRIYTKSQALSTGAIIVDLPGIHDSNAARSAVAQRYMQQCTGLWIVAPITRAVDDKAAKTLLGESFKMQLKYDGGFSNVTFVCSKTDDISIMEAVEALGLQEKVADLRTQEIHHTKKIGSVEDEIACLQQSRKNFQSAFDDTSDKLDEWMELQEKLDDGKTVYAPACQGNKRKRSTLQEQDSKRARVDEQEIISDSVLTGDGQDLTNDSDDDELAVVEPLQESDIKVKLRQFRETKKSTKQQIDQIQPKINELQTHISNLSHNVDLVRSEIRRICISGRNEYSKSAIKQDFAAGIKELDQEIAQEADEHSFNPDEEARDYDAIAQDLPVFCVSGRAYQHQCGRFQQDDAVPGFTTLEQTEMPQLQSHCQDLTKAGRIQTGRSFLLNLCQHLTNLELWASGNTSSPEITEHDKFEQNECMERGFAEMQTKLQEMIHVCIGSMKDTIDEQIFSRYSEVIEEATALAPETVGRWGANKDDGGLNWGTYRAVVRRNGKYQSRAAGQCDFNAEL